GAALLAIQETPAITQAASNPLDFPVRYRIFVGSSSPDTFHQDDSGRKRFHDASSIGEFPTKTKGRGDPATFRDQLTVHGVGL
ncbi:MAG: hypothetical protein ACK43N_24795, partial [Pirellulaceae bacterium]